MQKSEPTYHSEGHHNAGFFQCARCCEECKELIIDEYSIVILFLRSLTRRVPLIRTTTTLVSENLRVVSSWADRVSALFFYKIARPFLKKTQVCFTKQMHLFLILTNASFWKEKVIERSVLWVVGYWSSETSIEPFGFRNHAYVCAAKAGCDHGGV
jgi:hypothetical protein